jgi:hypothetical protein
MVDSGDGRDPCLRFQFETSKRGLFLGKLKHQDMFFDEALWREVGDRQAVGDRKSP